MKTINFAFVAVLLLTVANVSEAADAVVPEYVFEEKKNIEKYMDMLQSRINHLSIMKDNLCPPAMIFKQIQYSICTRVKGLAIAELNREIREYTEEHDYAAAQLSIIEDLD
ncbi:MAG: hypothetical protein V4654_02960 [Bdellovibrionota bacterium]